MFQLFRFRRLLALLFIVVYLSLTGFYLVRHAIGHPLGHELAYFWTWDMFPNYSTESIRRRAIGETASGEYVMLVPNSRHRFRWGVHGDVTRLDIDRRLLFFRRAAVDGIGRHNTSLPNDPVRYVYLAENYWPEKFNLPSDLYRSAYEDTTTGELYWASAAERGTVPTRTYWRILDEAAVAEDGQVGNWELSP